MDIQRIKKSVSELLSRSISISELKEINVRCFDELIEDDKGINPITVNMYPIMYLFDHTLYDIGINYNNTEYIRDKFKLDNLIRKLKTI